MNKLIALLLAAILILPLATQAEDGIAKTYMRWGQIINIAESIADKLSSEGYDMTKAYGLIAQMSNWRSELDLEMNRTELYTAIEGFRNNLFDLRGKLWNFGREYANLRGN